MFWDLMRAEFGEAYAESVAKDYVLSGLGGRTVNKALADGEDAKVVWRAVCDTFNIPESFRKKASRPSGRRSAPDRTNRRVLPMIEQPFHYSGGCRTADGRPERVFRCSVRSAR